MPLAVGLPYFDVPLAPLFDDAPLYDRPWVQPKLDARLDPARFAGLAEGDAHVIRNAGGRATDDAIRSLVISHKLLGTRSWIVVHHSDCGMQLFSDAEMGELLADSLATAAFDAGSGRWSNPRHGGGCCEGRFVKWHTIGEGGQEESVAQDVERIRSHPLVPRDVPIRGFVFDVKTGQLVEVPRASAIGRAAAAE